MQNTDGTMKALGQIISSMIARSADGLDIGNQNTRNNICNAIKEVGLALQNAAEGKLPRPEED